MDYPIINTIGFSALSLIVVSYSTMWTCLNYFTHFLTDRYSSCFQNFPLINNAA